MEKKKKKRMFSKGEKKSTSVLGSNSLARGNFPFIWTPSPTAECLDHAWSLACWSSSQSIIWKKSCQIGVLWLAAFWNIFLSWLTSLPPSENPTLEWDSVWALEVKESVLGQTYYLHPRVRGPLRNSQIRCLFQNTLLCVYSTTPRQELLPPECN